MDTVTNTTRKPMKKISELGFDIKAERCKRKLSRMDAAKYCGVSCNTFYLWEYGTVKTMRSDSFEKITELLGPDSAVTPIVEATDAVS